MVKWQFWSFLITQVFIILLTQLLCGFYNRKVSKNIIHGNRNLKEERALGERILFDRRISAGEQRAESSDIKKKKKKVKPERKWCCPGPTDIRWRKKTGRTPAGSWGASKWKGAVDGGEMSVANRRKMRPAQSGFYRCLLCYLHILRKPTAKIHTLPRALWGGCGFTHRNAEVSVLRMTGSKWWPYSTGRKLPESVLLKISGN